MISRRQMLLAASGVLAAPVLARMSAEAAVVAQHRVTALDLLPVRATGRTVWLIVRLRTDTGLTGLGEASDAFGFANTTAANAATMRSELQGFFSMIEGRSPLEIEAYRQRGEAVARK